MKNLISLFILFLLVSSTFGQTHKIHKEEITKHNLYSIPESNNGKQQSPINIKTFSAKKKNIDIKKNYKPSILSVANIGHTIQFNYQAGSTVVVNNAVYNLIQFHFHTPSEHLINGITYPLEMHIVHTIKDEKTGKAKYTVIGILFKEGKNNADLQKILDNAPEIGKTKLDKTIHLNINDFFNSKNDYYFYKGSLTTPPYTESVNWLVLSNIQEASKDQIQEFNKLEHNNARHIQAIFGRMISVGNNL